MRPDERELDDEIRGHLALSVRERIEGGQDLETARLEALRELGYVPAIRESMRRVWCSRPLDALSGFGRDVCLALRSLRRTKGLAATVVLTLALGIGANAAIFSVVRGVLLRPLVNRGEDRLVYIRQSAPDLGIENMTFSVPELNDLRSRVTTVAGFGDFSTVEFTMLGVGEPRLVRAGVVGGSYFEVMGLRAVLGRLLTPADDGPDAAGAAVLTHRFWTTALESDPSVIGRTIRLGPRDASILGVLEPSLPYPAETEIIANVVTSPHHLGAVMVTQRTHRMTELFGRLAPGASLEDARHELVAAHAAIVGEHPEAYPPSGDVQLTVRPLREQITAPARTILLLLLTAAGVVFVIACSNVANLILARSVRREGELAVRAALGASAGALRRMLLAETLVLCGMGAALGVLLAYPLVTVVARFASRFSVRALEVTVDGTLLWVGVGLAMAAAVLLAYIPRLPSRRGASGVALTGGSGRLTPGTSRRLRAFATIQIACSFVLLAGAGALVAALLALQSAHTVYETRQVLVLDVPPVATGIAGRSMIEVLQRATRRIAALPGVRGVASGSFVPWRDAGTFAGFTFATEGYEPAKGEESPYGRFRIVSPGFFAVLGVPLLAGRDFGPEDGRSSEPVVMVSQSLAQRMFPNAAAVGRTLSWTDPVVGPPLPRRIVGVVADVDDENVIPGPAITIYHPVEQMGFASRLFIHTEGDPYALVPAVTGIVREISADQAVERAATLEDVRADVLAPERLNAFVLSGFAAVALLIAVVGVSGVLAFSVSARTHEFGVRLAVGSTPRHLLLRVLSEGALIVAIGIAAGATGGMLFARLAAGYVDTVRLPDAVSILGAAAILAVAAVAASLMPAARASRVDVLQALRSE
jgi:putative ABC transport system permease protein